MVRTDNDTWDLASSVGATATMVAAARARATRAVTPLIEDRFAEPLVRAVGIDFFTRWATGELNPDEVDVPDAAWGLQHMTDVLAVRTRYIDAFFADATAAGISQAVILAAGLDARGYRLQWPAGMTVYEVDQPQVIEFKTATIAQLGAEPAADIRTVPVDLRDDWPLALRNAGFDTERPAAWAAEGLLGFLPGAAQDQLLDNITALSADGSRLVAETFMNSHETMRSLQAAHRRWYEHGLDVSLDNLGYPGARNDVATYLNSHGWRSATTSRRELLSNNGLPVPRGADDQSASANDYYCTAILRKTTGGRSA